MGRLVAEPIRVSLEGEAPRLFLWRRRLYRVGVVLARWREPGSWWQGEPVRELFRVETDEGRPGVYELCREGERWLLHRVLD